MCRVHQRPGGDRRDVPLVDRRGRRVAVGAPHDAGGPNLRRPGQGVGGVVGGPQDGPRQARALTASSTALKASAKRRYPAGYSTVAADSATTRCTPCAAASASNSAVAAPAVASPRARGLTRTASTPRSADISVVGREGSPPTTSARRHAAVAGSRVTAAPSRHLPAAGSPPRPTFPVAPVTKIMTSLSSTRLRPTTDRVGEFDHRIPALPCVFAALTRVGRVRFPRAAIIRPSFFSLAKVAAITSPS